MKEKNALKLNGFVGIIVTIALFAFEGKMFYDFVNSLSDAVSAQIGKNIVLVVVALLIICLLSGFTIIQPNQAKVLTLFGSYVGGIKTAGFWLTIPFTIKRTVSMKVENFNSDKLKVNDLAGNPIEIAAVVVYRVVDTAKAVFDVENYRSFVHIQSETGLRHIASHYPYDNFNHEDELSLRQHSDEICLELTKDLQTRLAVAGVEVIEARIMHLAYSSEIASAMLQRQQASAVLAARQTIVLGAVSMVKDAINQLKIEEVIDLDDEKKAQMVNNLLVAIVSEKGSQPVMNTGTVY